MSRSLAAQRSNVLLARPLLRRTVLRQGCTRPRAEAAQQLRVLITGSTKGLGLALAEEFLKAGSTRVVVNSRSVARVEDVVAKLQAQYGAARVAGFAADVSVAADVDGLAAFATASFGGVDCWINNAGSNGYSFTRLVDMSPDTIASIVATNLLGTLLCCRAAALMLAKQPQGGCIFNMEGAGSDGGATPKYACYGATKAGLPQLTKSLAKELSDMGLVAIHSMSPGMVKTELIDAGKDAFGAQGRFFVNALCEPPEYAASVLVPQVLALAALPRTASTPSRTLTVLTPPLAAQKLLRRILFGERKGRFYPEE